MLVMRCSYDRKRERLAHNVVEVDHRAGRLPLARERQQIPDDLRGPLGLAQDGFEPPLRPFVNLARGPLRQTLGPREDRRQRVVELVGDAGDGLTECRELLCLKKLMVQVARLFLELLSLADVADQARRFERRRLHPADLNGR